MKIAANNILLFLGSICTILAFSEDADANHRRDISKALSTFLCEQSPDPLPVGQWKLGVYDSQLLGKYLKHPRGKLLQSQLKIEAENLSTSHKHGGYAFEKCSKSLGWVLSTPSPVSVSVKKNQILLNMRALDRACKKISFHFAGALGGKSLKLMNPNPFSNKISLDTTRLPQGTLSVVCRPKLGKNTGKRELYLIPIKGGPGFILPHTKRVPAKFDQRYQRKFLSWVNVLRADHKLAPLKLLPQLNSEAKYLSASGLIDHNLSHLGKSRSRLRYKGLTFLGENRAQGHSPFQMAWLLFHSPTHRDLLIDKSAKYIGFSAQKDRKQKYTFVVVTAKKFGF